LICGKRKKNEILAKLPVTIETLQNCFVFPDGQFQIIECDRTLKQAFNFFEQNDLPRTELIEWLNENGGFCDCEVLGNVESKINDK